MAITQNTYTGDGSTVLFSFTFPYLETTDIKVSLNGTVTTAYTLANATTIQFNTAPTNGAAIRIYRQTDDASLTAQFYPGSAIRSQDLNDNFTQNLYVTQESNREASSAVTTANQAVTTAATAVSTANGAVTTANAATATANTAAVNAATAVSTANSAVTTANNAVTTSTNIANSAIATANSAASTAAAAASTANSAATDAATAISTANSAVSTANAASTTAAGAVSTANGAVSTANSAASTANTASTNASNAVSTANTALATANSAVTTANAASSTAGSAATTATNALNAANSAAAAVANAVLYDTVAHVGLIPASPSNNDAVEVNNSVGIESFTPLNGMPVGFVGDSGLSVRLIYNSTAAAWIWIQYFPNDPDNRYAGPNTNAGTASNPTIAFGPTDPNTGIFSPGADELALVTGGIVRLSVDAAGNVDVPATLSATNSYTESDAIVDGSIVLRDTANTARTVSFLPTNGASVSTSYRVPNADGTSGQLLSTNGSGVLSWINPVDISGKLDSSSAASIYLTITSASTTYAPLASPTFTGTVTIPAGASISGYLTTSTAASTYQTQSGMSSYAALSGAQFTGNVGMGIAPTERLHVSGNILATGNITAYSDARFKDGIETITNAVSTVCNLRGVTYYRTDDPDRTPCVGVIAQEVEAVLPAVVSTHSDGVKSVAYANIVAVLIEAIKEQQREIDQLKSIVGG